MGNGERGRRDSRIRGGICDVCLAATPDDSADFREGAAGGVKLGKQGAGAGAARPRAGGRRARRRRACTAAGGRSPPSDLAGRYLQLRVGRCRTGPPIEPHAPREMAMPSRTLSTGIGLGPGTPRGPGGDDHRGRRRPPLRLGRVLRGPQPSGKVSRPGPRPAAARARAPARSSRTSSTTSRTRSWKWYYQPSQEFRGAGQADAGPARQEQQRPLVRGPQAGHPRRGQAGRAAGSRASRGAATAC